MGTSLGLNGQDMEECLVVLVDALQDTWVGHTLQQPQHHVELVHIQGRLHSHTTWSTTHRICISSLFQVGKFLWPWFKILWSSSWHFFDKIKFSMKNPSAACIAWNWQLFVPLCYKLQQHHLVLNTTLERERERERERESERESLFLVA